MILAVGAAGCDADESGDAAFKLELVGFTVE